MRIAPQTNSWDRICFVLIGCLCLLLFQATPGLSNNLKIIEVTQKMSEITSMQSKVRLRTEQAQNIRTELNQKMRTYIEEVIAEQRRSKTTSYKSVSQKPRIHFDLNLIGMLNTYVQVLDRKIDYFESGQLRMAYLYQQAEDDLKLIETLNDMQVEDLVSRIDSLLAEYINELQNDLIYFAEIPAYSPERVWKKFISGHISALPQK